MPCSLTMTSAFMTRRPPVAYRNRDDCLAFKCLPGVLIDPATLDLNPLKRGTVETGSSAIPLNEPQNTAQQAFLAPSPLAGEGWGEGGGARPMALFAGSGRMDHPSPYPLPQGERVN